MAERWRSDYRERLRTDARADPGTHRFATAVYATFASADDVNRADPGTHRFATAFYATFTSAERFTNAFAKTRAERFTNALANSRAHDINRAVNFAHADPVF